jgi:glycosyltransferase involved in cell wall biosynthesis
MSHPRRPLLSVVVPAHNATTVLGRCLAALRSSRLPSDAWELLVVDDASRDDTELIAARYADTVVRLCGNPHGSAYARNRGAEVSRGEILVFVDADVVVHPDALSRIAAHFVNGSPPAAVFGSYDLEPYHGDVVSQYRNLLHHYVHQRSPGPAETFWSGLGAVRADVFREVGMFDEWHYSQPQIEDIELGRRFRRAGYTVVLDPAIQGAHLKRWTLRNMLVTDFRHRGVPWMWLLLQEGQVRRSHTLNVARLEKVCTASFAVAVLTLAAAAMAGGHLGLLAVGAVALGIVILINLPFYRYLRRHRSLKFVLGVVPLHLAHYGINVLAVAAGWVVHQLLGAPSPPPERQALAQVGIRSWPPPIRRPSASVWTDSVVGAPKAAAGSPTTSSRVS